MYVKLFCAYVQQNLSYLAKRERSAKVRGFLGFSVSQKILNPIWKMRHSVNLIIHSGDKSACNILLI